MAAKKKNQAFTDMIEALCQQDGVSHGELARRMGVKKPRIPTMLKCQNMSEAVFKRCLAALGYQVGVVPLGRAKPAKKGKKAPRKAKKAAGEAST